MRLSNAAKARNLPGRLDVVTCNFTARPYYGGLCCSAKHKPVLVRRAHFLWS
jgi:hypothetical protein